MPPGKPSVPSSIQDAQRTRVVVDAIVQAGLSARIAFSLTAGLAGQAHGADDDRAKELAETAQQAAERAKNADMALDMAFTRDALDPGEALREAGQALARAAEAYEVAADVHERLDAVETAQAQGSDAEESQPEP